MPRANRAHSVRTGNIPAGKTLLGECNGWRFYLVTDRRAENGVRWIGLKVVHPAPIRGRANYWIAYRVTPVKELTANPKADKIAPGYGSRGTAEVAKLDAQTGSTVVSFAAWEAVTDYHDRDIRDLLG